MILTQMYDVINQNERKMYMCICTFFSLCIVIMTPYEKQQIWRRKQIQILYGSGRPLFNISEDNLFERKNYDCVHYFNKYGCSVLDNKNFVPDKNKNKNENERVRTKYNMDAFR